FSWRPPFSIVSCGNDIVPPLVLSLHPIVLLITRNLAPLPFQPTVISGHPQRFFIRPIIFSFLFDIHFFHDQFILYSFDLEPLQDRFSSKGWTVLLIASASLFIVSTMTSMIQVIERKQTSQASSSLFNCSNS